MTSSRKDWAFIQPSSLAGYSAQLRRADLRVTRPRIAVIHAVHTNPHADAETVIRVVRDGLPDVSKQAVYYVLNTLTGVGLLRRIQPAGSVGRYETRVGDNHHHVVCRTCGAIEDVDCDAGEAPCMSARAASGFQVDEAEVFYWGRCPECGVSNGSQTNGAHDRGAQVPDPPPSPSDNRSRPHGSGHPLPGPPAEGWLSSAPLARITVSKAAGIGTGGLGANAGWARYDVSDATAANNALAGNGPRAEASRQRWAHVDPR
ncbi:ferric uptake regulation protein [Mycobacterium bohemicum DSM 44277]|uniref:Ferric uptake regulation protein n=1 Tax=Mycobacterium bohemicum DSM 44277 TaxID=1236609 RepID=A0A0U0W3K3_MYCBE|nr:ferric uptake regulation protein [Mycobacterium bohemicum DSM 44277]